VNFSLVDLSVDDWLNLLDLESVDGLLDNCILLC